MDGDSLILSQPLPTSLSLSPCDAAAPVGSSVSSKQQSWRQWSNRSHWIEVRRSELCSLCMSPERLFSTFPPPKTWARIWLDSDVFWCVCPARISYTSSARVAISRQYELWLFEIKARRFRPCIFPDRSAQFFCQTTEGVSASTNILKLIPLNHLQGVPFNFICIM